MFDGAWDERDFDIDIVGEADDRARDPVVDDAKEFILEFFAREAKAVFYQRQLQVIFEDRFFHWITAHALSELAEDRRIASDTLPLPPTGSIILYRARTHRYWRRQGDAIIALVSRFSEHGFTQALGSQGELMFDAGLASVGFIPAARKVRSHGGREWLESGHDLDRVYQRDSIGYGTEIKNTLSYIDRAEMRVKVQMCSYLGLRPLFIVRMAPKS